jgi:two-component system, OmpR family, phosphate regulon sensor histidine kinase PhoR
VKLTLHSKWFLGLAMLLVDLLIIVNIAINFSLPPYLVTKIREDLEREAVLAREAFLHHPLDAANPFAHDLATKTGLRVTIIAPDGKVIAESDKRPDELDAIENHLYRPEVQDALQHGTGEAIRHSDTINVDLMYVAAPLKRDGQIVAIVRVALPLHQVKQTTSHVRRSVAIASFLVILGALPVVYWLAGKLTRPIEQMRQMAVSVAQGDFAKHAPERVSGELGDLARALNQMAGQLADRLRELTKEKADLTGILAGMTEGVLVTDPAGKIRLINQTLRQHFQLGDEALGKTVLEVFRNVDLEKLIAAPAARELTFLSPVECIFAVNAATLRDNVGVVIVFHDITRLKQLENIRQEFVANVSHELRTPLSIIKGYVETLLDEQPPDPATARQFLETIQRHSRRLENLIEDLLNISALESPQSRLELEPLTLRDVAQTVADELARQAAEKKITVAIDLPADLPAARGHRPRLHQVFVNLLDNAIKYTPTGGRVVVTARATNGDIECCVADNGPGIGAEHLPRIFERFYRVDKARSRELGGTGLGLSIVKHIVQAHGGRVWAESEVGKGSRFYFTLFRV